MEIGKKRRHELHLRQTLTLFLQYRIRWRRRQIIPRQTFPRTIRHQGDRTQLRTAAGVPNTHCGGVQQRSLQDPHCFGRNRRRWCARRVATKEESEEGQGDRLRRLSRHRLPERQLYNQLRLPWELQIILPSNWTNSTSRQVWHGHFVHHPEGEIPQA